MSVVATWFPKNYNNHTYCSYILFSHSDISKASLGPYAWQHSIDRKPKKDIGADPTTPLPVREDMAQEHRKLSLKVVSRGGAGYLQHEELRHLPRSANVFSTIDGDPIFSYALPKPGANPGQVLNHTVSKFKKILSDNEPMTFKFGFTHCPSFRWYNPHYGYKYSAVRFSHMHLFYASPFRDGPAFVEASLIQLFGGYFTATSIL